MKQTPRHIVITDRDHGLPYSKGLMASSLTVSGLPPATAFRIAEQIEESLTEQGRFEVTSGELRDLAASQLGSVSERYATTYMRWQAVEDLAVPLIILVGGVTGVGKSTLATQLAARLGITRVISTDAIREVLRSVLSEDLMPTLHVSSFEAHLKSKVPSPAGEEVINGFKEQVQAVSVGIKALIARAIAEGTDIIVEGAHVVPGFLSGWEQEFADCVLVPLVMSVSREDLHRSHFYMRSNEKNRPGDKYISSFEKIRLIQGHINALAERYGVQVVEAFDLDSTINEVVAIVVEKALTSTNNGAPRVLNLDKQKPPPMRVMGRRKDQ